jgi:hypothetical protein
VRNPVRSHKVKFDGTTKGPWDGDLVEVIGDEWLVVFYEPPPVPASTGEQPAYGLRYHGTASPLSILVYFNANGAVMEYHCDAAFPATIEGRDITFVDLDLDVVLDASLRGVVRDFDDFAANRVSMGYTDEAIAFASAGVMLAWEMVERRDFPFDGHPARLLGKILAAQGPV